MSPEELRELRENVSTIRDVSVATSRDVCWIKDSLVTGSIRMDGHEKRIGKLENRQHWYSGVAAAVAAIATFLGHKTGLLP